jgi:hypothetical protein
MPTPTDWGGTKGGITTEKTVWCGICNQWEQAGAGGHVKRFKHEGWRRSKKYGWLCPVCAPKYGRRK